MKNCRSMDPESILHWTSKYPGQCKVWQSCNSRKKKRRRFTTVTCRIMRASTAAYTRPLVSWCATFVASGSVMDEETLLDHTLLTIWFGLNTRKSLSTGQTPSIRSILIFQFNISHTKRFYFFISEMVHLAKQFWNVIPALQETFLFWVSYRPRRIL